MDELEKAKKKAFYDAIIKPAKFMALPKLVFRQSKPAIIGIESLSGTIKQGQTLINKNGEYVGVIASMEDKGETLPDIPRGQRVAMAIKDAVVGKHFDEGDELYIDVPEKHYKFITPWLGLNQNNYKKYMNSKGWKNKKEILNLGYSQTTNFANLHEFSIGSYYSLLVLVGHTPLQASLQGILPILKIHSCRMGITPWEKA